MNPFAHTAAGLFIVLGPKSRKPLIAEQICSAVIEKLMQDPARQLEAQTWTNIVQNVPNQVSTAMTSNALARHEPLSDLPRDLAKILAGPLTDLIKPIAAYLEGYGAPTAVNCLVLDQSNAKTIQINLATVTVKQSVSQKVGIENYAIQQTFASARINISDASVLRSLEAVFSNFQVPDDAPYYQRITT